MNGTCAHIPKTPFTAFIVGCLGSGKTVFYTNLLKYWDQIFDKKIGKLYIIYGFYQSAYDTLQEIFRERCHFETDLTENMLKQNEGDDSDSCTVIIIDDVAHRICDNELLVQLFIGASHHRNILVFLIMQNLYASCVPNYMTIMRNCKVMFLFRQPRDQTTICVLGQQIISAEKRLPSFNSSLSSRTVRFCSYKSECALLWLPNVRLSNRLR